MSTEKNMNARIQHKHDIEENWQKATNFIPKAGELIIYDVDYNYDYPRLKIGDGNNYIEDLPFTNDFGDLSALAPGSFTWDGNLKDKTFIQVESIDNASIGFVKVSDKIFTAAELDLFKSLPLDAIIGIQTINGYVTYSCVMEELPSGEGYPQGVAFFPKDSSEMVGVFILLEEFMGVSAGVYFSAVVEMGYVVAYVSNFRIPGYNHSEVEDDPNFELTTTTKLTNVFELENAEDGILIQGEVEGLNATIRYLGNLDLSYEELVNTTIYCVDSLGNIIFHDGEISYDEEENRCSMTIGTNTFMIYYGATQGLIKPGLYAVEINFGGILIPANFSSIVFEGKMFTSEKQSMSLIKEVMPDYLQFGEIDVSENAILTSGSIEQLGDTLYFNYGNSYKTSIFWDIRECRAADYKIIPDNTNIIVTISDVADGTNKEAICTGSLSSDKTSVTIMWDGTWSDGTKCSFAQYISNSKATVAKINNRGIYLTDHEYSWDMGWRFRIKSIQFVGMSFTRTDYIVETVKETEFRTLDKQYLPEEIVYQDELNIALNDKQDIITGAASTITSTNLNLNSLVATDASGKITNAPWTIQDLTDILNTYLLDVDYESTLSFNIETNAFSANIGEGYVGYINLGE